jgi:hypothetical protein
MSRSVLYHKKKQWGKKNKQEQEDNANCFLSPPSIAGAGPARAEAVYPGPAIGGDGLFFLFSAPARDS